MIAVVKVHKTKDTFFLNTVFNEYTGCREWVHGKSVDGYGRLVVDGAIKLAHRYIYELTFGKIPKGMVVRHKCHNPQCCNPEHLLIGTQQDNIKDMMDAGRQFSEKRNKPKTSEHANKISASVKNFCDKLKSDGNKRPHCSKITEDNVREMRKLRSEGTQYKELAIRYGITKEAARYACIGRTWNHVV